MSKRRPTPEMWAEIRVHLGTDEFRQLWVKPEDNVLIGWWNICNYLGIKDRKTLGRWVDQYALPAVKRPDGVWITTMTAIDQWIMLAAIRTRELKNAEREATNLGRERAEPDAPAIRSEALP